MSDLPSRPGNAESAVAAPVRPGTLAPGPKRSLVFRVPFACGVLALYAFGILSIGLTKDWRLLHEDNGAVHTTLALSHLRLGLARTRAHDVFYNPKTGQSLHYGHHPPATALILAAAFALTGSDSPAVARAVVILFHLGSVFLFLALVSRFFSYGTALLGGFLFVTLPMSAYFGRMVDYEPLCLFAVLLQLNGYVAWKSDRRGLIRLSLGILLGGVIDWASFFFTLTIALVELADLMRRRSQSLRLLTVLSVAGAGVFLFDLWHLWYAGRGSLAALNEVLFRSPETWPEKLTLGGFLGSQLETARRYFTAAGLLSGFLVASCLALSRRGLARSLLGTPEQELLKRVLAIAGGAALVYILAAPHWAAMHVYWQFYFLPYVALSVLLIWRLLLRKAREPRAALARVLLVLLTVDLLVSSFHMLSLRHTRVGIFAVDQTARLRALYLAPESHPEKKRLVQERRN
jgi:hypothetical protein